MKLADIKFLLKEAAKEAVADKVPRLGAALSYFAIFAMAPLLLLVISVAGVVFGDAAVEGQLIEELSKLIGHDGAQLIQELLASARSPKESILASIGGLVALLLGSTGFFIELRDALNTVWGRSALEPSGWKSAARKRFKSFAIVISIGILLLLSLSIQAGLSALYDSSLGLLPVPVEILHFLSVLVFFAVITVLFALVFKVLPDADIAWGDVWIGATFTSILFIIGEFLLGAYLGQSSLASSFGPAAALVFILVWVYYSSQILLFGAEFTEVYSRHFGSSSARPRHLQSVEAAPRSTALRYPKQDVASLTGIELVRAESFRLKRQMGGSAAKLQRNVIDTFIPNSSSTDTPSILQSKGALVTGVVAVGALTTLATLRFTKNDESQEETIGANGERTERLKEVEVRVEKVSSSPSLLSRALLGGGKIAASFATSALIAALAQPEVDPESGQRTSS